jgi:O-antigen/teichoic acid export membrane protein
MALGSYSCPVTSSHKVVFNIAAMYARVLVSSVLSLFASRFILAALGVVDFGLYSVIAGIMGFMAFLNGAMSTSSQRHLTHELGRGDMEQLNRIFKTSLLLHAAIALLLVILGETVGLWFLNHVLNIPTARQDAAFWIYQFTVIGTACSVISVPYSALLTAHEALAVASLFGIIQSVLAFTLALMLTWIPGDRLIGFVFFSSLIAIAMTLAQMGLCRFRYRESRLLGGNRPNRRIFTELLGFSSWTLVGHLSFVCRLQGVAFMLNIFFGPVVNAAFGIANQVSSMMAQLTQVMQQAISPRMVKQEGSGNRKRMLELSLLSSKFGFCIACFWGIPLFAEIETVLSLWLKNPPEHTAVFCRIVLLIFVSDQLSSGYGTTVLALGKLARYQTVICSIHLSTLPLAYLLLKLGCNQDSVLLSSLFTMIVASASRGWVVRGLADFPYSTWVKQVALRGIAGVIPGALYAAGLVHLLPPSTGRLLFLSVTTGLVTAVGIVLVGMTREERQEFRALVLSLLAKVTGGVKPSLPAQ